MDNNYNSAKIEKYVSSRFTYFWGDGTWGVDKELIEKYLIEYRKFPEKKPHILNMLNSMDDYFKKRNRVRK